MYSRVEQGVLLPQFIAVEHLQAHGCAPMASVFHTSRRKVSFYASAW